MSNALLQRPFKQEDLQPWMSVLEKVVSVKNKEGLNRAKDPKPERDKQYQKCTFMLLQILLKFWLSMVYWKSLNSAARLIFILVGKINQNLQWLFNFVKNPIRPLAYILTFTIEFIRIDLFRIKLAEKVLGTTVQAEFEKSTQLSNWLTLTT